MLRLAAVRLPTNKIPNGDSETLAELESTRDKEAEHQESLGRRNSVIEPKSARQNSARARR
jgi:hypothetical protein